MLAASVTLCRRRMKKKRSLSPPEDEIYHSINEQALLSVEHDNPRSMKETTFVANRHDQSCKSSEESKYYFVDNSYDDCQVDPYSVAYVDTYKGHTYSCLCVNAYTDNTMYSDHKYSGLCFNAYTDNAVYSDDKYT